MDFHSLSRRELQSLSKKNKIPANITNVAMADALKALKQVEGLDEILNQTESNPLQSPENPHTARRKPSNAEPGSRATRRTAAEEVNEEEKTVNVTKTPAAPTTRRRATVHSSRQRLEIDLKEADKGLEKRDMPESPAVPTSRRKAPAMSSRRKTDDHKDEGSVQRVYSTRRSVRLLGKSMSKLSLKEQGRLELIKMTQEGNEDEKEISETKLLGISLDGAQETDGLESSDPISDGLDNKKTNDYGIGYARAKQELGGEKSGELENPSVSTVQYQYESERSNKIDVILEKKSLQEKESDVIVARSSSEIETSNTVSKSEPKEELNDSHDFSFVEMPALPEEVAPEIIDHVTDSPQGINDSKKVELLLFSERNELSQELATGNPKADGSEKKPSECHKENGSEERSKDNSQLVPDGLDSVKFESGKGSDGSKYFINYEKSVEVLHQLVSASCDMNGFPNDSTVEDFSDPEIALDDEPKDNALLLVEEKSSESSQENRSGEVFKNNAPPLTEETDSVKCGSAKGYENSKYYEKPDGVLHQPVSESCHRNDFPEDNVESLSYSTENNTIGPDGPDAEVGEEFKVTSTLSDEGSESEFVTQMSPSCPLVSEGEAAGAVTAEFNSRSTVLDEGGSEFVKQMSPTCPLVSEVEDTGTLAMPKIEKYDFSLLIDDINVTQAEEFGTTIHGKPTLLDKLPFRGNIGQNAQLAADSLSDQCPGPYLSSTKKQTTLPVTMQDSVINKENIDMSGGNLEVKRNKMKEKNVVDKVILEGESIRSLKKMLKKKLVITENTKEKDSNVTKEEKTRTALQKLPGNCLLNADPVEI